MKMISTSQIFGSVFGYLERFPQDEEELRPLFCALNANSDVLFRKRYPAHITCGAVVFNERNEVLQIYHKTLKRWLLPGGHVEAADFSLRHACLRELFEEVGIAKEKVRSVASYGDIPIEINFHGIPRCEAKAEPLHSHWDFRFVFEFEECSIVLDKSEVIRARFSTLDKLPSRIRDRLRAGM